MPVTREQIAARRRSILDAAETLIAKEGLGSLTARGVAEAAGCSVGLIYRNFEDLDGLILEANSRFIGKLDEALGRCAANEERMPEKYVALALTYLRFGLAHRRQWAALFEHRMPDGKPIPEWHLLEHLAMFRHVAEPLAQMAPALPADERDALARTIYSAVHGIVSLSIETRLGQVPVGELERQIELFVRALVAGLQVTLGATAD